MPAVEDYRPLAPFTFDELLNAANSVLRDKPRLLVTARTIRYYISEGLLPPPIGPNKTARYTIEHLERLVNIREQVDSGARLDSLSEPRAPTAPREPRHRETQRLNLGNQTIIEFPADRDPREALIDAAARILEKLKSM